MNENLKEKFIPCSQRARFLEKSCFIYIKVTFLLGNISLSMGNLYLDVSFRWIVLPYMFYNGLCTNSKVRWSYKSWSQSKKYFI